MRRMRFARNIVHVWPRRNTTIRELLEACLRSCRRKLYFRACKSRRQVELELVRVSNKRRRQPRRESEGKVHIAVRLAGKSSRSLRQAVRITLRNFLSGSSVWTMLRRSVTPRPSLPSVSSSVFVSRTYTYVRESWLAGTIKRVLDRLKAPILLVFDANGATWTASTRTMHRRIAAHACDFSHARRRNPSPGAMKNDWIRAGQGFCARRFCTHGAFRRFGYAYG